MNTNLSIGVISLAVLSIGGGVAACASLAASTGTGGSGGAPTTGTGGTTRAGGASGAANGTVCHPENNTNLSASAGIACPKRYSPARGASTPPWNGARRRVCFHSHCRVVHKVIRNCPLRSSQKRYITVTAHRANGGLTPRPPVE
jgi:hypothetical protein